MRLDFLDLLERAGMMPREFVAVPREKVCRVQLHVPEAAQTAYRQLGGVVAVSGIALAGLRHLRRDDRPESGGVEMQSHEPLGDPVRSRTGSIETTDSPIAIAVATARSEGSKINWTPIGPQRLLLRSAPRPETCRFAGIF